MSHYANLTSEELAKFTTMRDVVARCEEGFAAQITAHQKQMDKVLIRVESMQAMINHMNSVHAKQNELLFKRDARIEQLETELNRIQAASNLTQPNPPPSPTPSHLHSLQDMPLTQATQTDYKPTTQATQTEAYNTPTIASTQTDDLFTPAISVAVQHVSEAISAGLSYKKENDGLLTSFTEHVDLSKAVSSLFQGVLSSLVFNKPQEIHVPKNTITQALQNVIQSAVSSVVISSPPSTLFTSIDEAVSFIEFKNNSPSFVYDHTMLIEEKEEVLPELLSEYSVSEDESEEEEDFFWDNKNLICNSSDDSDVETIALSANEEVVCKPKGIKLTVEVNDDGYVPYSRSLKQPLLRSLIFNRWSALCVALFLYYNR